MKKIYFLLFVLLLPLSLAAQNNEAVGVLERAVDNINADAAVQMAFDYVVYNNSGIENFADNGSLKLDGNSYSVLLAPLKLWCDGTTQWSYMANNHEIYITDAGSDDAQIYNPVYLMGLYKKGYACTVEKTGGENVVTLVATSDDQSFERVVITLDAKTSRPLALCVYVENQGYTDIKITSYKPKCLFDKRVYSCPLEDFPGAEIVDMR